jgi:transcription elongation factor SPT6
MGSLKFRMQLWVDKLMGKTVYINAIGFIKVVKNPSDEEQDILDSTRIHPENYVLAKKIAKDALDFETDEKDECVNMIM